MTKTELWDKLGKLGLTDTVKQFINKQGEDLAEYGYTNYTTDSLYLAMMEGVEKAGCDSTKEFADGEILAMAYFVGYLLGKNVIKNEA